jgi:flagellar export protein FliJ
MAPKFSLQTVLDVRHSRVEALEIALGELLMAQREGETMLASLEDQRTNLFHRMQEQQNGDLDLVALDLTRANVIQNQEKITQVVEALRILAERREAKRKEVVTARQEEETLSILKRKEVERFNLEEAERESRAQDDIYIAQAFRQSRQEA